MGLTDQVQPSRSGIQTSIALRGKGCTIVLNLNQTIRLHYNYEKLGPELGTRTFLGKVRSIRGSFVTVITDHMAIGDGELKPIECGGVVVINTQDPWESESNGFLDQIEVDVSLPTRQS